MTKQDLANYLSDVEGLEGVELRQLESFLKTSEEEKVLGNLYRMTTLEGMSNGFFETTTEPVIKKSRSRSPAMLSNWRKENLMSNWERSE